MDFILNKDEKVSFNLLKEGEIFTLPTRYFADKCIKNDVYYMKTESVNGFYTAILLTSNKAGKFKFFARDTECFRVSSVLRIM